MLRSLAEVSIALLVGATGGALFYGLGAPLPWTLGSLAASALAAIAGNRWVMPHPARDVARPVIGVLAGSAFTAEVVASVGDWWGAILFVLLYSVFVSLLGWIFFRKICRLDPVTAYFSSTPGGLAEFTLVGAQLGGSIRTLVTIHAVRIVMVVFTVPFLMQIILGRDLSRATGLAVAASDAETLDWLILAACGVTGYVAAKRFNLPGGVLVASMVLSAGVHATGLTQVLPPFWLVALVQVIVGSIAGSRFAGITWGEIKASMAQAVVWGIVLLATACGFAALGAYVFGRPFAALVLSMSPGGMQEMIIISYALGIETAFVIACHVCRSSFVLTFAPILFRRLGVGAIPPTRGTSAPGGRSQS